MNSNPRSCLKLQPINKSLVLAVLEANEKSDGGIYYPGFKLYHRDASYAASGIDFLAAVQEWDERKVQEAKRDYKDGYWAKKGNEIRPIVNAVVIGESPELSYMYDMPRFGDVLTVRQMASAECLCFHKLGADTNAANEILVKNFAGDRSVLVNRNNVILVTPIEDVIGVVARYDEIKEWANHEAGRCEGRTA